tara:strand:- start:933 stop:1073 length:141 start_codon:yes stop_codon:yes gene_type:complete
MEKKKEETVSTRLTVDQLIKRSMESRIAAAEKALKADKVPHKSKSI